MPESFKPRKYTSIKDKILLSIAPAVLQVHILFFLLFIVGICLSFLLITYWDLKSLILIFISLFSIALIYFLGAHHYTKRINKKIESTGSNIK